MEIKEIFDLAKEHELELEKHKKETIIIQNAEDIEQAYFQDIQIKTVCISHMYEGPLPDLSSAINIGKMQINSLHSWEEVLDSIPPFEEELSITVPANAEPGKITNPLLKSLKVYFRSIEESSSPISKYTIDFSGVPNVKGLTLFNAQGIDLTCIQSLNGLEYLKCEGIDDETITLPDLPSLTELDLSGSFYNIILTKEYPNLKKLSIGGDQIESLDFLQCFPALEDLQLYCPRVEDVSVTDNLLGLKYIYCHCGDIINTGELLSRKEVTAVLTEKDRDLEVIKSLAKFINIPLLIRELNSEETSIARLLSRRSVTTNDSYVPSYIKRAQARASMSREERFCTLLQREFEKNYFNKISPFDYRLRQYEANYKQLYIDNMIKQYPFLTVSEPMRQQLLRETRPLAAWVKAFKAPGSILFASDDLLTINVRMVPGNGKFTINTTSGNDRTDDYFEKQFKLRSKLIPGFDPQRNDYIINITQFYFTNYYLSDCVLPILLAIKSLRDSTIFRSDTVLGVQFPNRFQDKRKLYRSDRSGLLTRIVELNGFPRIILTGKKDFQNDKIDTVYCKQFDDIYQALVP